MLGAMTTLAMPETERHGANTGPIASTRQRLDSVDLLRGLMMIVMALDHTRDFFGMAVDPTDIAHTTVPLFLTRWVTHFCAPVFFLLTGVGAALSLRRQSKRELSRFLLTRGLWLIVLELTLFRCLGFQFNFDYQMTLLNVLWPLGWSMVLLSALVYLPTSAVTAIGLVMIAGHNALDSIHSSNPLWTLLHSPGFLIKTPHHAVFVLYVLIPWVGVTAVGYGLGHVFAWPAPRRRSFLLGAGLSLTAAFVVLRVIQQYGDPSPWTPQPSAAFTLLSFLNTNKYPPSLLYLLMTLGPALVLLWAFDGRTPRVLRPALTFGRVPLFYYLLHVPLIHLLAILACYARYGQVHWMFEASTDNYPIATPPGWGYSLPIIYAIWALVIAALYPLCRWFAGVKQRRNDPWLSYL